MCHSRHFDELKLFTGSTFRFADVVSLFHAVACKRLNYFCINCLRCRNIYIATRAVALLLLGDASAMQRTRQLRIALQGGVVIGNGVVELTELKISEAASVERIRVIGS